MIDLAKLPAETRRLVPLAQDWAHRRPSICCVWFFGSRVRGNHRPDSDLDVAIALALSEEEGFDLFFDIKDSWQRALRRRCELRIDLELLDAGSPKVRQYVRESGAIVFERAGGDCARRTAE